jgi:hypothetical protein
VTGVIGSYFGGKIERCVMYDSPSVFGFDPPDLGMLEMVPVWPGATVRIGL